MGNFRETFGNFLETVRVVIGQESVRVGMWSRFEHLGHADTHRVNLGMARGLVLERILYLLLPCNSS
jgi:hypothetical protein